MTVSYQDLINLANVLELDNPTAQEKYNVKFADRSGNDFNPDKRDLDALLNALVGKDNTDWVGSNCSYTEGNCERVGSGLQKEVKPSEDQGPYSKCNFGNDGAGAYIPQAQGGIQDQFNCPDLQSCPTNSAYYWKVEPTLKEVRANNSAYLGSLKDISQPGRCEQRYLGNEDNNKTTNDPNDPNCNRYESGDGNGSGCIPSGSNAWECRPYGDIMRHTAFPNAESGAPYKIKKNRNAANAIEDDGSIQHACASNPIRYGGAFSASQKQNKFEPGFDGQTDPDWNLLYTENAEDGTQNIVQSGETRDCKIRATYAKYVKKGNYAQECDSSMPLYPGSTAAATYDLPLNGETAAEWWNKNSCVWVNSLPFDADLNANWVGFEPQILNGDCGYDDFVAKDADGVYRTIDSGSATNMPSSGADIASTEDGCFGQVTQGDDQDECHPITALIDHNTLKRVADAQKLKGIAPDPDLWPGMGYVSTSTAVPPQECGATSEHRWVDNNDTWVANNSYYELGQDGKIKDSNVVHESNINGKYKEYKTIPESVLANRNYSVPCYFTKGVGNAGEQKNILLTEKGYRHTGYGAPTPTWTKDLQLDRDQQNPSVTDSDPNPGNYGRWYNDEAISLINEGSSLGGQSDVRLISSSDHTNIADHGSGYGDGECWSNVRIDQVQQYNSSTTPYVIGDETDVTFKRMNVGNNNNENIISDIGSYASPGDRIYYKCNALDRDPSVDAHAEVEYAWVNEN